MSIPPRIHATRHAALNRLSVLGIALALAPSIASAQGAPAAVAQAGKPADSTAKAAPVADTVPSFFKDVQANAFVSFGYNYNLNSPSNRINPMRVFDRNANSLLVDVAELVLQKSVSKIGDVGFRVDLEAGSAIPQVTQSAGLAIGTGADLQQALVSYIAPVGAGLRLDFGKFVTHLGLEVIEGYDGYNDNYSRSLLFNYAIAFTHTGVKAGYTFSPQVAATAMIVNGWDLAVDNNKGKSIGLQLALTPASPLAIYLNYMGGPETADTGAFVRHIGDIVATYKVSDMLTLGINGDYGLESGASAVKPKDDAKWSGVAGYVKISPDPKFFVALRAETFKDEGGTRLGLGKNTTANEFTVTPTYKVSSNFVVRAEGRYDSINQDGVFADDKGKSKKNQATIGFNAIFVY
jgi:Putative beta-barrel porin-2, OmpL-like. bbp2